MKISVFYCLTVYVLTIKADETVVCSPNSVQSIFGNRICYLFVKDSKTFADAESFCNQKNGNLAAVTDQFINIFLAEQAAEIFGNVNHYWIGGTLKTVKVNGGLTVSVWVWTREDSLMSFSDWDTTATVSGNCIGVDFRSLWSAIDCKTSNPFVCEVPELCDDGWTHFSLTHSCYKQFSVATPIIQQNAEDLCVQKGGHLASIHLIEENQFIGELTSIGYPTALYASRFWIGAARGNNSDSWRWVDNTPFDYANWGRSFNYTNLFCADYWPDKITDWANSPMIWNAGNCNELLYSYLCKKQSYKL